MDSAETLLELVESFTVQGALRFLKQKFGRRSPLMSVDPRLLAGVVAWLERYAGFKAVAVEELGDGTMVVAVARCRSDDASRVELMLTKYIRGLGRVWISTRLKLVCRDELAPTV
jgi:hypothetical protein